MRTTSVFINKLGENGFPFSGKVKFTLMSTDPDFSSYRKPVEAFFINGKAKVQLIPNIFISRNVSTYYHYEIFAQHPVNSATEVEFELIEEGDCIVPIKPSCLQEILIPTQIGYAPSSGSSCNCEPYPKIVQIAADALNPNNPVSLSTEKPTLLFIHTHQGIQASIDQLTGNPERIDIHLTIDPEQFSGIGTSIYRQTSTGNKYITVPDYIGAQYDEQYPQDGEHGLVPAATAEEANYFLKGDGTWQPISTNDCEDCVHIEGTETINGVKTFNAGYFGKVEALVSGSIDVSHATAFTKTVNANTTFTFSGVPTGRSACFSLKLENGGDYIITWPSSVHWCNETEPELTSGGIDVLTFITFDGGITWYGTLSMTGII